MPIKEAYPYIGTGSWSWESIGTAYNPSVADLQRYQSWDTSFRQGEYGAFRFDFKVFPDASKDWILRQVDGILKARGVITWRPSEFDGNALVIYFQAGIAPLIIAGIVLGALVVVAFAIWAITVYKLKYVQVEAQVERQEKLTDAIITAVNEGDLPASVLNDETKREADAANQSLKIFEKPLASVERSVTVLLVVVGAVAVLLLVLQGR